MRKLFYTLEDHFDALAERFDGSLSGRLSRALTGLFGLIGDALPAIGGDSIRHRL